MDRFLRVLRAPGAKHAVEVTAPTVQVAVEAIGQDDSKCKSPRKGDATLVTAVEDNTCIHRSPRPWRLDRWLDKVVE